MIKAKNEKADLICFGESFIQGFDSLSWKFEIDKNIAISQNSKEMKKLKQYTIDYHIDLLIGYIELDNDDIYSSYALISNGDIIHNHHRISKGWKEYSITDYHYKEGTSVQIIDYKDIKFVVTLCGELWDFPNSFKLNEDLLIWGVYYSYSIEEWKKVEKEYIDFAKSICNNVAYINSISHNPDSCGGAWYINNSKIINKADYNDSNLIFFEYKKN